MSLKEHEYIRQTLERYKNWNTAARKLTSE